MCSNRLGDLPAVSLEAESTLNSFRQGEIVSYPSLMISFSGRVRQHKLGWFQRFRRTRFNAGKPAEVGKLSAEYGVVVISQTCDIVQSDRLTVQIAPLVKLDEQKSKQAASGRRTRYALVSNAGPNMFVDLEQISTVHKNVLATAIHKAGSVDHRAERVLAYAIGRRFTRFPFPDNLHPWLRPLEGVIQEKAGRSASSIGKILEQVKEFRVLADGGWEKAAPYDLTILAVVEKNVLPFAKEDEIPEQSRELSGWLRGKDGELTRTAHQISQRLLKAAAPVEKYHLWLALGEAWAIQ